MRKLRIRTDSRGEFFWRAGLVIKEAGPIEVLVGPFTTIDAAVKAARAFSPANQREAAWLAF